MLNEMSNSSTFIRPYADQLVARLHEPRRFIQVLAGPRQVGKTTLIGQAAKQSALPARYASADEPTLRGAAWIEQQWQAARATSASADGHAALLVLDEVQKISGWSEVVKRLWDEDTREARSLKVVILGSAPLLVEKGLSESLAGRFELFRLPHWSFPEMRQAFGWSLQEFIFYGAYPGAAPLIRSPKRWARYIRDSLIEPIISRDVLLLSRVDKPALLRRLLELGSEYSGQVLSYTKMLGQLHDAGNTTTLAHYLELLSGAGLITGLQKYSPRLVRRRASSPKLQVLNSALITSGRESSMKSAMRDTAYWGRLVESAVGAHLANAALLDECRLYYWRERNQEVDFVLEKGGQLLAIEVKSGSSYKSLAGLNAFSRQFPNARKLLVGADGVDLAEFLSNRVDVWFG